LMRKTSPVMTAGPEESAATEKVKSLAPSEANCEYNQNHLLP
jgi:hypothetical protein